MKTHQDIGIEEGNHGCDPLGKALNNLWIHSYIHENSCMLEKMAVESKAEVSQHYLFNGEHIKALNSLNVPSIDEVKFITTALRKEKALDANKYYSETTRQAAQLMETRQSVFQNEQSFYTSTPGKAFLGDI